MVQWCWVNFQCRGVLLIWIIVGQGPTALVIGAGGGCLDIFLSSVISHFYLPLSGRRPDSLPGSFNPKQPTNHQMPYYPRGWSGGAIVLDNFKCKSVLLI